MHNILRFHGSKKWAFTLVELIVVITIVGIISTIGFVSYTWYLVWARDTKRIATLTKAVETFQQYATSKKLPLPDNSITITSSWVIVWFQGKIGKDVLETIWMDENTKDPKDDTYYSYFLWSNKKTFQFMAFMEEEMSSLALLPSVHSDNQDRYPRTFGTSLGIMTQQATNLPLEDLAFTSNTLELTDIGNTYVLSSYLSWEDYVTGTWATFSELWDLIVRKWKWWRVVDNAFQCFDVNKDGRCPWGIQNNWPTLPSLPLTIGQYSCGDSNAYYTIESAANNAYGNSRALAGLKTDGSIESWGSDTYGGVGAPSDNGYVQLFTIYANFVALKPDGSMTVWWSDGDNEVTGAPTDNGYITVSWTQWAFAALKSDGSITTWWDPARWWVWGPTDSGYTSVVATARAFTALNSDGRVVSWWDTWWGNLNTPTDSWYVEIFSNFRWAFWALKSDGSIHVWGNTTYGGRILDPNGNFVTSYGSWFTKVVGTGNTFWALRDDGTIHIWWQLYYYWDEFPTDTFVDLIWGFFWFIGIRADGTLWIYSANATLRDDAPTDGGYVKALSTYWGMMAVKADGSISSWWTQADWEPTDNWYVKFYAQEHWFAAMKADGSIASWWSDTMGGLWEPTDTGYINIYSAKWSYHALKPDGSITSWWNDISSGVVNDTPITTGFIGLNWPFSNSREGCEWFWQ